MRLHPILAPMALDSPFSLVDFVVLRGYFIPYAIDLDRLPSGARGKHEASCGNDIAVGPVTAKKKKMI